MRAGCIAERLPNGLALAWFVRVWKSMVAGARVPADALRMTITHEDLTFGLAAFGGDDGPF